MASLTLNCLTHETLQVPFHFYLDPTDVRRKEGYYPARARFGNQIPIEYLWAAKGRLDSSQGKGFLEKIMVEKRMWCDYPHKTRRISDEDLTLLGARLCLALEHIERSLTIRNRRLGKKPIDIPKIPEFTLGTCNAGEKLQGVFGFGVFC